MRIEYHRTLIADEVRNRAFEAALAALIVKGKTVVADIGAGTGLLGLMAARLGASEVYLYETAEVAGVAAEILKRNRARNCHLMPCHSTEMVDPPRVDLVVSETLGNHPFEEHIIETLNDARARHLKPGGEIIPGALTQLVCPVVCDRIDRELRAWDSLAPKFDFSFARIMSLNNAYVRWLDPHELLEGGAAATAFDRIDFTRRNKATRRGEARWRLESATTVFGLATWWEARLAPGITLSTGPAAPRTHWEQLYLPLLEPVVLAPGETLQVALRSTSSQAAGTHLSWSATTLAGDGRQLARQALDLDKGYLP